MSTLHKKLHHLALESRSGRAKAEAYASSLSPGGVPSTPWGSSMGTLPRTPGPRDPNTPPGASLGNPSKTPGEMRVMSLGLDHGGDLTPTRTGDPGSVSNAHSRQTPKTHPKRRGGSLGGSRLQSSQTSLQVTGHAIIHWEWI